MNMQVSLTIKAYHIEVICKATHRSLFAPQMWLPPPRRSRHFFPENDFKYLANPSTHVTTTVHPIAIAKLEIAMYKGKRTLSPMEWGVRLLPQGRTRQHEHLGPTAQQDH
jgi:hypothetical protein